MQRFLRHEVPHARQDDDVEQVELIAVPAEPADQAHGCGSRFLIGSAERIDEGSGAEQRHCREPERLVPIDPGKICRSQAHARRIPDQAAGHAAHAEFLVQQRREAAEGDRIEAGGVAVHEVQLILPVRRHDGQGA